MNKKEIKTKGKSTIYSGEATLVLKHGKRTYKVIKQHNNATAEFLTYILKCMVGGSYPQKRPGLLYLYEKSGSLEKSILSFPILYEGTTNVETSGSSASVNYTFLIPDTFLPERVVINGFRINSINSSGFDDQVYAIVDFKDNPVTIESNTNLYVTWKVTLSDLATDVESIV